MRRSSQVSSTGAAHPQTRTLHSAHGSQLMFLPFMYDIPNCATRNRSSCLSALQTTNHVCDVCVCVS